MIFTTKIQYCQNSINLPAFIETCVLCDVGVAILMAYQIQIFITFQRVTLLQWAGWLSRYSDWLRAGRSGDRIPVGGDFPHLSRLTLGPIQLPVQWVPGLSRGKEGPGRDADPSSPSSAVVTKW